MKYIFKQIELESLKTKLETQSQQLKTANNTIKQLKSSLALSNETIKQLSETNSDYKTLSIEFSHQQELIKVLNSTFY